MRAWSAPEVPQLPVTGPAGGAATTPRPASLVTTAPDGPARLYVCGITPYDATHIGHAATYVGFDLLNRAWRNAGHQVVYVQNVTDVDDPLLERAAKVNVDWTELAERETELFRQDMQALRVLPPDHYVGAVESIPLAVALIERLQEAGLGLPGRGRPLLLGDRGPGVRRRSPTTTATPCSRSTPSAAATPTGPARRTRSTASSGAALATASRHWDSPLGPGRPGWHIECAAIAREHLGVAFDVQGGGSDLVFPHHEMCAGHAQVADPSAPFAKVYSHAGMVAYDGEKMSKSKGNLVFVSALRNSDVDPMAIRLVLLRHHFRSDWEWLDAELWDAVDTLADWRRALSLGAGAPAAPVVTEVLAAMADDLDAPRAVAAVQGWVDATLGSTGHLADTSRRRTPR